MPARSARIIRGPEHCTERIAEVCGGSSRKWANSRWAASCAQNAAIRTTAGPAVMVSELPGGEVARNGIDA